MGKVNGDSCDTKIKKTTSKIKRYDKLPNLVEAESNKSWADGFF